LIYMERMAVQNRYNLNPSDPTLRATANYLFSILRYVGPVQTIINNLQGSRPVLTGPANQSVLVGATATFSVAVTSSTPTTFQWYLNNVPIPGATNSSYLVTNAQLGQSGGLYSMSATNSAGTVLSTQATLTVTASLSGFMFYTAVDPGPTLLSNSDPFAYQTTFSITHNQPLSIPISQAAASNQFLVIKVPSAESTKTTWFNTALNSGNIPDIIFAPMYSFNNFDYYYTKSTVSMDPTQVLAMT
jgi:hypothetical protein